MNNIIAEAAVGTGRSTDGTWETACAEFDPPPSDADWVTYWQVQGEVDDQRPRRLHQQFESESAARRFIADHLSDPKVVLAYGDTAVVLDDMQWVVVEVGPPGWLSASPDQCRRCWEPRAAHIVGVTA